MKLFLRGWINTTCYFMVMLILAIATRSISAQGPAVASTPAPDTPTDVEVLKERVKQLEQTVEELKRQIGLIGAAQKQSTESPTVAESNSARSSANTVAATTAAPSTDTTAASSPAKTVAKSDNPQGESKFEVYGFALLDAGFDFKSNDPNWFDVVRPTKLPAFAGQFNPEGKTYWGVRQSRLGVRTSTPTKYGELKTIFEFELFGTGVDAGQTTFRLRHAWGELGKFGAGQYWTTFGDTDAYPNTFEYWGPNGLVWFRNVQLRWTPIQGRNEVAIALERPGASADQGNYADRIALQGVKPRLAWPDLVAHARWNRDWGHVQISGLLRSIRWEDTVNDNIDLSGSAVGVGGSLSSHLNFGKKDVGRFQVTYGQGIENYMNDAPVDVGVRVRPGDAHRPLEGVALPVFGMSSFLDHTWNKKFSSSFGYSMLNISNTDGQAANAFRRGHYGIGNLLWTPIDNVTIASEFQWGRRENFLDGFGVNDFRLQFGFKYNFSKVFKFNE